MVSRYVHPMLRDIQRGEYLLDCFSTVIAVATGYQYYRAGVTAKFFADGLAAFTHGCGGYAAGVDDQQIWVVVGGDGHQVCVLQPGCDGGTVVLGDFAS